VGENSMGYDCIKGHGYSSKSHFVRPYAEDHLASVGNCETSLNANLLRLRYQIVREFIESETAESTGPRTTADLKNHCNPTTTTVLETERGRYCQRLCIELGRLFSKWLIKRSNSLSGLFFAI